MLKLHNLAGEKLDCSEKRNGDVANKNVLMLSSTCLYQEGGMPGFNKPPRASEDAGLK